MSELFINEHSHKARPLKVVVIGAGISGIAFHHLASELENLDWVLYEKNPEVTGTWYEATYPGCSCDIPSHSYTYSWRGNPNWSQLYVSQKEIFEWFRGLAEEYGVYEKTKLEHKVIGAKWIADTNKWEVEVENLNTGEIFTDSGDILLNCGGILNRWNFPDIEGLHSFKGPVLHTASWDHSVDYTGKRVAVIGSGASGIQVVPAIHPKVKHLISFNRSPNWIAGEFASELATDGRFTQYSEEERSRFRDDPEYFLNWRKKVEHTVNCMYEAFVENSGLNKEARKQVEQLMRDRLKDDPELCKKLIPTFALGCRRLTPGNNYLETLVQDNVDVVSDPIIKVSESGIHTQDGKVHEVDIIVTATGYDTSFVPRFPIVGLDGIDLRDRWANGAESYMGVSVPQLPNYFMTGGPNSPLSNGSLLAALEKQVEYCLQFAQKIQTERISYVVPAEDATRELNDMIQAMHGQLSFTSHCTSWFKRIVDGKPKITGPWPGSGPHYREMITTPRYEDYHFKYEKVGEKQNRFRFLGNGFSVREAKGLHLGSYVREEKQTTAIEAKEDAKEARAKSEPKGGVETIDNTKVSVTA